MKRIFAIVGAKRSGKTTTAEALIRELSTRGYSVGAVKHVSEDYLSFDEEGKDTWRYAEAGASTIVGVAGKEVVTIEKTPTAGTSLDQVLKRVRGVDVVVLEGFKKLVAKRADIPKIVPVKNAVEVIEAERAFTPIVAFTGPFVPKTAGSIPFVDVLQNSKQLTDLVLKSHC